VFVLLTAIFWAVFFLPGYACLRGALPGFQRFSRVVAPLPQGGILHNLAYGYALSFGLLSPTSLLCYALSAPVWLFSAALCGLCLLALVGLSTRLRRRGWQLRRLRIWLCAEPWLLYGLLIGLLCLQARLGGWLDGDATFHLGRIRVLLEHGFTNRDVYLREYHFQHAYHSNLLFAVYASAAQLTGQSYFESWFHSEAWAKLLVAAGHFVLGHALTRSRAVGYALAICIVTLNAGETYTLYPNTLCVGYLLPMLLGLGLSSLRLPERWLGRRALLMGWLAFVVAQLHALYVIYAAFTLAPVLALALLRRQPLRARWSRLAVLCSFAAALPFIAVSMFGFKDSEHVLSAPEDLEPPKLEAAPPAAAAQPAEPSPPSELPLAMGGGHLEKVLDSPAEEQFVFRPARMGGVWFVGAGYLALLFSCIAYSWRARKRALPLIAAGVAACWLGAVLFTRTGVSLALRVLREQFIVARLSTVLTSLLVLGACALVLYFTAYVTRARWRSALQSTLYLLLCLGCTQLPGHAPKSFSEHLQAALAPAAQRRALLDRWLARRALLQQYIPAGSVVLTTPRQARYVVMLCDCYVLAADRGHTGILGIDKRRRDLNFLNSTGAAWEQRAALIKYYGVRLVTFERRWQRRYSWAYQHGKLLGSAAGQDVIELSPF
jgi:hypothetical protein